jgi:hypothetical protein
MLDTTIVSLSHRKKKTEGKTPVGCRLWTWCLEESSLQVSSSTLSPTLFFVNNQQQKNE